MSPQEPTAASWKFIIKYTSIYTYLSHPFPDNDVPGFNHQKVGKQARNPSLDREWQD